MKTILIALTGLMLTAAAPTSTHATEVKTNNYVLSTKSVEQSYSNLVVLGEVDITLVQGTSNQITMEGYEDQLKNLTMEVKGNTLYIKSKGNAKGKKPLVYVPVSNFGNLKVKGNSMVTTLGYLQSPAITLELDAECSVQLKSTGKITISEASSNDYEIEEWIIRTV